MRPILLAMNNPLSSNPCYALAPFPAGSAGHRLWRLLEARRPDLYRKNYMDAFDRRNLLPGRTWDQREANRLGSNLYLDLAGSGSLVLVLGEGPRRALGLPRKLIHPVAVNGCVFRQLPHPSGRCRWYNDPTNRLLAGMLLEELYENSVR